jgi:1,4-dihydroxy-2-naphthoate octaprenyltransferase
MELKSWFFETRPQFLILSLVLGFLGNSMAWYDGFFHLGYALLSTLGLLLLHISVNTLNDYFDYRSGIDLNVERTPFSGGSGFLPSGLLKPRNVLWFGVLSFFLAVPIGIYFMFVSGWLLLPLLVVGSISVLLYTPIITKLPWPEWAPGLGLGVLPVLGFYFIQTSHFTLEAVIGSIPSGILVHNLLLLNEFPDVEADMMASRKTLPIVIGKRKAGLVYSFLTLGIYFWIMGNIVLGNLPGLCMISILTLPLSLKAIEGALKYNNKGKLMLAMKNNVLVVLLTQFLMGLGFILSKSL